MLQNLWPIVLPVSTALAVMTLVAAAWHQDRRRQVLPAAWVGMRLAPRVPRVALARLVAVLMLVSAAAAAWKAMG